MKRRKKEDLANLESSDDSSIKVSSSEKKPERSFDKRIFSTNMFFSKKEIERDARGENQDPNSSSKKNSKKKRKQIPKKAAKPSTSKPKLNFGTKNQEEADEKSSDDSYSSSVQLVSSRKKKNSEDSCLSLLQRLACLLNASISRKDRVHLRNHYDHGRCFGVCRESAHTRKPKPATNAREH